MKLFINNVTEALLNVDFVFNISISGVRQEVKVRPMRSSLKPMCELMRKFKKHIHLDFIN